MIKLFIMTGKADEMVSVSSLIATTLFFMVNSNK